MPKKPKPAAPTSVTNAAVPTASTGSTLFVVAFEHARRAFKCVLVDWPASDGESTKQWMVTVAGRAVWSFPAGTTDTRESVQDEVARWWDGVRA